MDRVDILEARCKRFKKLINAQKDTWINEAKKAFDNGELSANDYRFLHGLSEIDSEMISPVVKTLPVPPTREEWLKQRMNDLLAACKSHAEAGELIAPMWMLECIDILTELEKLKEKDV